MAWIGKTSGQVGCALIFRTKVDKERENFLSPTTTLPVRDTLRYISILASLTLLMQLVREKLWRTRPFWGLLMPNDETHSYAGAWEETSHVVPPAAWTGELAQAGQESEPWPVPNAAANQVLDSRYQAARKMLSHSAAGGSRK